MFHQLQFITNNESTRWSSTLCDQIPRYECLHSMDRCAYNQVASMKYSNVKDRDKYLPDRNSARHPASYPDIGILGTVLKIAIWCSFNILVKQT